MTNLTELLEILKKTFTVSGEWLLKIISLLFMSKKQHLESRPLQKFLKTFIEYREGFKVKNTFSIFDFEVFTEFGEK